MRRARVDKLLEKFIESSLRPRIPVSIRVLVAPLMSVAKVYSRYRAVYIGDKRRIVFAHLVSPVRLRVRIYISVLYPTQFYAMSPFPV